MIKVVVSEKHHSKTCPIYDALTILTMRTEVARIANFQHHCDHKYEFRSCQRLFFVRFFLSNFDILVKRFSARSALT
jgi:hypothetical protein